jgi:hypothetical protein
MIRFGGPKPGAGKTEHPRRAVRRLPAGRAATIRRGLSRLTGRPATLGPGQRARRRWWRFW